MKNIDITAPGFPARLTAARERAGLSKTGLAEKAGLSYRTVHNLETGRLTKAQEKTLLLLCEVLGIAFQDLVPGDVTPDSTPPPACPAAAAHAAGAPRAPAASPAPVANRRRVAAYALVLAAVAVILLVGNNHLRSRAVVEAADTGIIGRDPLFGRVLWRVEARWPRVLGVAPWDSEHVLATAAVVDGGRLLCLDRRTGRETWRTGPDFARLAAVFGRDEFGRTMNCTEAKRADIDGDGTPEILAVFTSAFNFVHCVAIIDRAGRILHQYAASGRVGSVRLLDLDQMPGQEVVVTSTEIAPGGPQSMLVVLDRDHFAGVAADAGDSSRARLVFAARTDTGLTHPGCRVPVIGEPSVGRLEGAPAARLMVVVLCARRTPIQMELDGHLELIRIVPNDMTRRDMLAAGGEPEVTRDEYGLSDWTRGYLAGARRYVAGRRVPFAGFDSLEVASP